MKDELKADAMQTFVLALHEQLIALQDHVNHLTELQNRAHQGLLKYVINNTAMHVQALTGYIQCDFGMRFEHITQEVYDKLVQWDKRFVAYRADTETLMVFANAADRDIYTQSGIWCKNDPKHAEKWT